MNFEFKKRLIIWVIIFVASGLAALWTSRNNAETASFKQPAINIAFADTSAITQIEIVSVGKEAKKLTKSKTGWLINSKFKVRNQLATLLLFALNKIEIKRPVESNKDKVLKLIKAEDCKVNIIGEGGLKQSFYIASNPSDANSSYYLQTDSHTPYLVYVPGVKGEIGNLLKLPVQDWRTRDIFISTPRSLESVTLNYNDRKQEGFEINYRAGNFGVSGIENPDTVKLKKYVSLFGILGGESFVTSDSIKELINKSIPAAIINVKDIDEEKSNQLKIYFLQQKLYGLLGKSNEIMLLNPQIYKYVLIDKNYFKLK